MPGAPQTPTQRADLDALFGQAVGEHRAGRLAEAAAGFRQVLDCQPNLGEVQNYLGVVLCQLGQFDEALTHFERAIALEPRFADAYNNLGNVLRQLGKLDEAATRYLRAIELKSDYPEAHHNLGSVLLEQGQLERAAEQFERAIALRPDHAEAHYNLGNVFLKQDKLEPAAACYKQALTFRPALIEAHINLGNVLWQQGRLDEAAARFEQALAFAPKCAEALTNLGAVLIKQGQLDEAAARFERAIVLKPDHAEAYNGLGSVLARSGRLEEARRWLGRALALRPDFAGAERCLAGCYLLQGDYERGWPAYEARLRLQPIGLRTAVPRWSGEPLAGRSLLLVAEQGLGDTIQFIRYAREFKRRGARVVLAASARLGRLLATGSACDELFLFDSASSPPACDFYLPLLSAPYALWAETRAIPGEVPYLAANAELTRRWNAELASTEGFKIGIVWQGSRGYASDRWRSIPLRSFAALARLPGTRLVSLQKGVGSEQVAEVDFPVLDLSDRLDEAAGGFMDTAAVIANLDLVITSDTAMAHLAGALGAPVWVALGLVPDWRWLLGREDCPWYPTMRLFRQKTLHEWSDVFERIAGAVEQERRQRSNVKGQT